MCDVNDGEGPASRAAGRARLIERDRETKQSAAKQSSENILVLFQKTDQNE